MANHPHLLLAFCPKRRTFSGSVEDTTGSTRHIAYGLWGSLAVILLMPSPRGSHRRMPTEDELLRAYGIATAAFSYL